MKKIKGLIFFVLLLVLHCDLIEVSVTPTYPTTYSPLSLLKLDELNKNYHRNNDGKICSTLNEFGYTGYSRVLFPNDRNPCLDKVTPPIALTSYEDYLLQAKLAIIYNQKFTNVTHLEELVLKEFLPINGCTICEGPNINNVPLEWKFTFSPQFIEGMEVLGTEIVAFVDANGVNRIWGNWYKDFYAPELLDIGYIEAEQKLLGFTLNLYEFLGVNSFVILNKENIGKNRELHVLPMLNDKGQLELRKTWKIPIILNYPANLELFAFVDVVSSKIVNILKKMN